MKPVIRRIEALVWWLRCPERFIHKARAFLKEHPGTSLRDPERVAHQLGIEVLNADLGPHIYGATTRDLGQPVIVLHPDLTPWHREFTIAHELGHAQLHLPEIAGTEALSPPTTGGMKEVEADAFAVVSLLAPLPDNQQVPAIVKYVVENPNMGRRAWRIIRYFIFYYPRIWVADVLERLFLGRVTKGAH